METCPRCRRTADALRKWAEGWGTLDSGYPALCRYCLDAITPAEWDLIKQELDADQRAVQAEHDASDT